MSCAENYPDDQAIPNDTQLFRRIPPCHCFFDENMHDYRPSSAAFDDDDDGDPMSVYLSTVLGAEGRQPASVLAGREEYSLASITAGLARQLKQTVHPQPVPEESSHTVVCGDKPQSRRKKFALGAIWVVLNPPPPKT